MSSKPILPLCNPKKRHRILELATLADSFEQAKLSNSFEQQLPKSPLTGDTAYSVSELRQLISAARAENKPPFTEANFNKLLSANRDNYKEIAADLKGWINKNMYLSPRQKGPLDRMNEDDLKKVQDFAQTATELNKLMSVKITNYDESSAEKVLKLQETEISDTVRLHYGKVQPSIAEQHQQEAAQNAAFE